MDIRLEWQEQRAGAAGRGEAQESNGWGRIEVMCNIPRFNKASILHRASPLKTSVSPSSQQELPHPGFPPNYPNIRALGCSLAGTSLYFHLKGFFPPALYLPHYGPSSDGLRFS